MAFLGQLNYDGNTVFIALNFLAAVTSCRKLTFFQIAMLLLKLENENFPIFLITLRRNQLFQFKPSVVQNALKKVFFLICCPYVSLLCQSNLFWVTTQRLYQQVWSRLWVCLADQSELLQSFAWHPFLPARDRTGHVFRQAMVFFLFNPEAIEEKPIRR